jgi:hypothetical protein
MEINNGNFNNTFECNICNKKYTNKSGIWKHNNKYHKDSCIQNNTNLHKNPTEIIKNPTELHKNPPIIQLNKYECEYCNNIFSRNDSLKRHYNICKYKEEKIKNDKESQINTDILLNENNKLKLIIEKQSEEIKEVKLMISSLINKNCKVHPKTLQKINKQLINDNKYISINKGTVNNTYNIIGLGHENLTEVFSRKEKMAILKNRFHCLPELVEYAHFNDKYPQFKNILITNTQNTLAYKYDTKKKQFVAVNKDDLLDDIVDERMCDINSFYDELENDLDEKTKEIIEKVKDKIENDPAYKELKKKDIKLIIYNNRKKVIKDNLLENEIDV